MLAALALIFCGCERKEFSFPLDRAITNSKGTTLDVTLLGRDASSVSFRKKGESDGKIFKYSLSDLIEKDRRFIERLPLVEPPKPMAKVPRRIQLLRDDVADTRKEIQALRSNLGAGTMNQAQRTSNQKKIDYLKEKLAKKKQDLADMEKTSLVN